MYKLKRCPFCGGEARFFSKLYSARGDMRGWEFGVYCTKCDITSPVTNYKLEYEFLSSGEIKALVDDRQRAANDWNRRVGNGV